MQSFNPIPPILAVISVYIIGQHMWREMKNKINWDKQIARAERQLKNNKEAIEFTAVGTPASWSRPDYDKPLIAPAGPPTHTKIHVKKMNKKKRKQHNKTFVPKQKAKAKRSDETGGLPIVRKTNQ